MPTDEDIAALPHFHREQLILIKFLGSGAFGEVFEGMANNIISNDSGDTKVAVKVRRMLHFKSSSENMDGFYSDFPFLPHFREAHVKFCRWSLIGSVEFVKFGMKNSYATDAYDVDVRIFYEFGNYL